MLWELFDLKRVAVLWDGLTKRGYLKRLVDLQDLLTGDAYYCADADSTGVPSAGGLPDITSGRDSEKSSQV